MKEQGPCLPVRWAWLMLFLADMTRTFAMGGRAKAVVRFANLQGTVREKEGIA